MHASHGTVGISRGVGTSALDKKFVDCLLIRHGLVLRLCVRQIGVDPAIRRRRRSMLHMLRLYPGFSIHRLLSLHSGFIVWRLLGRRSALTSEVGLDLAQLQAQ